MKDINLGGNNMKKCLAVLMIGVFLLFGCVTTNTTQNTLPDNVRVVHNSPIGVQIMVNVIDYKTYVEIFDALNYAKKEGIDIVRIHLLSPGGAVHVMFAVYDLLMEFKAKGLIIETHGYGVVGSAAVPIFLAGDIRTLNNHGYIMIHPHSGVKNPMLQGNVNKTFDEWTNRYAQILVDRTKITKEEALGFLNGNFRIKAEWINANRALKYGLITEIRK